MKSMRFVKVLSTAAMVAALSVVSVIPAFAGSWNQNGSQWKYQNDNGSYATGWQWVDGKCYYFDNNGVMAAGTTTPDGYTVDNSGAWTVNGVVQTQNAGIAIESTDEAPLAFLKDYFVVDQSGVLRWRWGFDYLWQVHPESDSDASFNHQYNHTGTRELQMQEALRTKFPNLMTEPAPMSFIVLARLAGVQPVGHEDYIAANSAKIDALEAVTRDFLNSFDWKNASNFEKAVKIAEKVNETTYTSYDETTAPDVITAYGCLVDKKSNCNGSTSAATFLALCTNTPAEPIILGNHGWAVFEANGIWLSFETTTHTTTFDILDPMTGRYGDNNQYYLPINEYLERSGYQKPTNEQVRAAFPNNARSALVHGEQGVVVAFH